MKKAIPFITLLLLLTAILYSHTFQLRAAPSAPQAATPIDPIFPGLGIITSRTMADGRIATSNLGIFGPNICIDYGDPYSPLNSPYAPGPHTYQYRIRIPENYPSNIVRVELFDPDSINQAENEFTISRSNTAINNGYQAVDSKICSSSRINPCLLNTDELDLIDGAPNLSLDLINPYWLVRIDEHRGNTTDGPPGNGECGNPGTYNPLYNTNTFFGLSYYQQDENEPVKIPLVSYIGQTGDDIRDSGDHNTDMRWVSPGADVPFSTIDDPGSPVPAIAGTTDSFEIDLTTDLPNILTDTQTGDRYLYLDVMTLSGSSENGYEIWAGPPDYVTSIPSEVNTRNLHILNNPGSHDSQGLEITAVNTLLQNSLFTNPIDIPLATIGSEFAGSTISIRLYDTDSGAEPPIVFYFDTIAFTPDDSNPLGYDPNLTDWAMAFAVSGQDDPDGVAEGIRCVPGSCQTQWVDPPYQITIPGDLSTCDWSNPTPENCTPFYGGRLMVQYVGGFADTYAWEISSSQTEPPSGTNIGCAAFPITVHEGAHSVTAPGVGSNPYPNAGDFSYPLVPPSYDSFVDHVDDLPLLDATPGDVFRVSNGFGNGNFGWLVWNEGISATASTLANSLAWPGDSIDYTDHGDGGSPVVGSSFPYVVRGYLEPGDPTDQDLHLGDWMSTNLAALNATGVQSVINEHIDLGRTLRLPIWDNSDSGGNGRYQTSHFGIFRLVGYNITENWLLLEFISHDTSCGQLPVAPSSLSIAGSTEGTTNSSYSFAAITGPADATSPITYIWEVTDYATFTETSGINNTVMLNWATPGSKTITVTAENGTGSPVSQIHTIDITYPKLYLPFINNE